MATVSTRITTSGSISTTDQTGFSVERNTSNYGFMPYKVDGTKTLTANTTLVPGDAGVIFATGSGPVTGTMPNPANCPGAMFICVNQSEADIFVLTASQGGGFVDFRGNTNSKISLAAEAATVLVSFSGGFFVLGTPTGSITYSG